MDEKNSNAKRRTVFQIIEKPGREKAVWMRMGVAYVNQDQSINVYLDAIPYERKLQIREEDVKPRHNTEEKREPATLQPTFDLGRSIQ